MKAAGTKELAGISSAARELEAGLAVATLRVVGRVNELDRADDLAIALSRTRLAVVRCVGRAAPADHTALATMMSEGDFVWAGLVYGELEGSETVGLIETFHVSELDRLVSRLLELRGVFGEPG